MAFCQINLSLTSIPYQNIEAEQEKEEEEREEERRLLLLMRIKQT
jgi:hypothetical protein